MGWVHFLQGREAVSGSLWSCDGFDTAQPSTPTLPSSQTCGNDLPQESEGDFLGCSFIRQNSILACYTYFLLLSAKINDLVSSTYKTIKTKLPSTLRSMSLYLSNKDTELILFKPVRVSIAAMFSCRCFMGDIFSLKKPNPNSSRLYYATHTYYREVTAALYCVHLPRGAK